MRQELGQQQKRAMKAPWDYEAQNRANAELMIDRPKVRRPEGRALAILTSGSYGARTSPNEKAIWVNGRPVLAETQNQGDGCSCHEGDDVVVAVAHSEDRRSPAEVDLAVQCAEAADAGAAVHSRENCLASDPDEGLVFDLNSCSGFVFDLDGCSQEWSIFDSSQYCDGTRTSYNKSARGRLQLDSGYYLESGYCLDEETVETANAGIENSVEDHVDAPPEEDNGAMTVNVRYQEEVCTWEVDPNDSVQQVQLFVQNKWDIAPGNQRLSVDGLLTPPSLRLGLLGVEKSGYGYSLLLLSSTNRSVLILCLLLLSCLTNSIHPLGSFWPSLDFIVEPLYNI